MAHVANYEGVNHGQYAVQVSTGIALPGGAYFDAPAAAVQGMAIVRSEDEKSWILIPDHRGEKIYYTGERYSTTLQTVGEVPAGYTLIAPETDFDTWNGTEWVTDSAAEKKHIISLADEEKTCLLRLANERNTPLQYVVDLEMATDSERAGLLSWKNPVYC